MSVQEYRKFLESQEFPNLDNPVRLIQGVLKVKSMWAVDMGVPYMELFHEGVVTLLTSKRLSRPEDPTLGRYFDTIWWGILRYIRECYLHWSSQEVTLSQLIREGRQNETDEYEEYMIAQMRPIVEHSYLSDDSTLSLEDLIHEIMKIAETRNSGRVFGKSTRRKIRQTLYLLSLGYNYTEIAHLIGYTSGHVLTQIFSALRQRLREDNRFMLLYGNSIPEDEEKKRSLFSGDIREGEFEQIRRSFLDLFGGEEDEKLSKKFAELFPMSPEDISADGKAGKTFICTHEECSKTFSGFRAGRRYAGHVSSHGHEAIKKPDEEELLSHNELHSVEEIARIYGISTALVRNWLRELGAGRVCQKCGDRFTGHNAGYQYAGHMSLHKQHDR
ncbi:hypothetical protein IID24_04890 [Patescibacteria group bacterium]|nr:hypothetical protein [Patescibacteria group bacterium]